MKVLTEVFNVVSVRANLRQNIPHHYSKEFNLWVIETRMSESHENQADVS
jgi:hypothetical protein